jgi:DNA-binding NtrC family response regulator
MITILVIDDDRHMRAACARAISRAGWNVLEAETGDEGLRQLQSGAQRIDVVLLDQLMPGMSGVETLEHIRTVDPHLPVVIITGSITENDAKTINKQGAFDCLPKPFNPEQLREVVRRALSG